MLYDAARICREIPEAEAMAEDTLIDDRNFLRFNEVLDRGRKVFLAGLDGATGVALGSGGGSTQTVCLGEIRMKTNGLCPHVMRYAHAKCYPGSRHKRIQSR